MWGVKKFVILCAALAMFASSCATAGVVMVGTRVIYPQDAAAVSVQLRNTDDHPNIAQLWVDDGRGSPEVDDESVPFVVAPPLFRLDAGGEQSVRITALPNQLPSDRESLFWFNFQQIPPLDESAVGMARIELSFIQQIKLIYRPRGLKGDIASLSGRLELQLRDQGRTLRVTNPTGLYANFVDNVALLGAADGAGERQRWPVDTSGQLTLAPFSSFEWSLPRAPGARSVSFAVIDDNGRPLSAERALAAGG